MSYVIQTDLDGKVPAGLLLQTLDDDGDGIADEGVWDKIALDVGNAIDGRLSGNYEVPLLEPYPAIVKEAAMILAAEAVYMRRMVAGDQNPWTRQAEAMRKRLEEIGAGTKPLTITTAPKSAGGTVITESSRLNTNGAMLV